MYRGSLHISSAAWNRSVVDEFQVVDTKGHQGTTSTVQSRAFTVYASLKGHGVLSNDGAEGGRCTEN